MTRYGYRVIFNEMESILKRNYITKNWLPGTRDLKKNIDFVL